MCTAHTDQGRAPPSHCPPTQGQPSASNLSLQHGPRDPHSKMAVITARSLWKIKQGTLLPSTTKEGFTLDWAPSTREHVSCLLMHKRNSGPGTSGTKENISVDPNLWPMLHIFCSQLLQGNKTICMILRLQPKSCCYLGDPFQPQVQFCCSLAEQEDSFRISGDGIRASLPPVMSCSFILTENSILLYIQNPYCEL